MSPPVFSLTQGNELFFSIELITSEGLELEVDALLDTGFSDWLAIDEQDLDGLGWQYIGNRRMLTARGDTEFDIYEGKVLIDEQEFDIPIHVGVGIPEVLIGRGWLETRRLVVDIPLGILTLG
ncbi:MAG: aspartyl protease [Symploca sp. SIO2E6]|nr:aspartyl protease [Symploca sp. SIO2E6]